MPQPVTTFTLGVFVRQVIYDGDNGRQLATITLDTTHPEVRAMMARASRSKGQRAVEASGALIVWISPMPAAD